MTWGVTSGGWLSGLIAKADDKFRAHLDLMAEQDLHATEWSGAALMGEPEDRRKQVSEWLHEQDVRVALGIGFDFFSGDAGTIVRGTEAALETIGTLAGPMRAPACLCGIGRVTSFTRSPSMDEQVDILAEVLAPIARAAAEAGCPLGIHNVGHYCSDLARVCRRVPRLGIFFDSANPFLVGEKPVRAAEDAAPHVVGMHVKDHYATPSFNPLGLNVRGAVLGQGDVRIREIMAILRRTTPRFDSLPLLMEIDPIEGMEPREAFRRCTAFVRSL